VPHLWDDSGKWGAMYQGIYGPHVFFYIEVETSIFFLSSHLLNPFIDWLQAPSLISDIHSPSLKVGMVLGEDEIYQVGLISEGPGAMEVLQLSLHELFQELVVVKLGKDHEG
jgi:hypothetical protein